MQIIRDDIIRPNVRLLFCKSLGHWMCISDRICLLHLIRSDSNGKMYALLLEKIPETRDFQIHIVTSALCHPFSFPINIVHDYYRRFVFTRSVFLPETFLLSSFLSIYSLSIRQRGIRQKFNFFMLCISVHAKTCPKIFHNR